jgi:hypothetical protein
VREELTDEILPSWTDGAGSRAAETHVVEVVHTLKVRDAVLAEQLILVQHTLSGTLTG